MCLPETRGGRALCPVPRALCPTLAVSLHHLPHAGGVRGHMHWVLFRGLKGWDMRHVKVARVGGC